MILETERLALRELVPADLDELHAVLGDAETMRYYPAPFDRGKTSGWIEWNIGSYREHGFGLWAVILKETGAFVGDCGITMQDIDGETLPELGYHIAKEHWNKGYASEAAGACMEFAFVALGLETLYTYTKHDNLPSRRVAEKIGMAFVKEFEKTVYGVPVREALYRLRRADSPLRSNGPGD